MHLLALPQRNHIFQQLLTNSLALISPDGSGKSGISSLAGRRQPDGSHVLDRRSDSIEPGFVLRVTRKVDLPMMSVFEVRLQGRWQPLVTKNELQK